ncbi:MAG TPA: glutamine amidotransferase, partial [Vicinamibacterales bacterium]
ILVDGSRSMSLEDADSARRIDRARGIVEHDLIPTLSAHFHPEVLRFGERLAPSEPSALSATDRRTALGAALQAVRDRYRGRPVAGIVLVSDGGDNGEIDAGVEAAAGPPIYAIGVGPTTVTRDREVVSATATESVLTDALVDVGVSAVSTGYGKTPFDLRLLENGRPIDVRRVNPAADGVPISATFHVSPGRDAPTVYTVEVPAAPDEIVSENNVRSVLVPPPARPRRVLLVEGAPGFEHSFLKRAWAEDRGLEIDSVVRKGRDDSGADTFYVQAARSRADALTSGYPRTREALFAYDVIALANVDVDQLKGVELDLTRAFVGERGGGLLVLGARAFQRQSLRNTPLENVLPLELADRAGGVLQTASPGMNRVALTPSGEEHPVMQLAPTPEESMKRWASVPPLASISALGGPRPGAAVLAVTGGPGGVPRALVAVQRYGEGRSMIFTGEAAWRWRMMLPTADQSYDRFWRQAARWLGQSTPDPVALTLPIAPAAGDLLTVMVDARDAGFQPQRDALVNVRLTSPDGHVEAMAAEAVPSQPGRFRASTRASQTGVYRVTADARRDRTPLGSADGAVLVGGVDPEMTDPRLNEEALERVARASGGLVITPADLQKVVDRLNAAAPAAALAMKRDLWHTAWSFAVIAGLLAVEWLTRRYWGLR